MISENSDIVFGHPLLEETLKLPTILGLGLCLTACGQSEPRSVQYFEAHPAEARGVLAECRAGSESGDECTNADVAVQTIEGREKFERFRRRD